MIMSKNAKMTSETLIRVSYYGIFGRNQHSGRLPPLLHPLFVSPFLGPPTHQIQTLNLDFLVFKSSSNFDIKSIRGKSDGESSLVKFWRWARMSEMIQFFKRCHRKYCKKPPNSFLPLSPSHLWH